MPLTFGVIGILAVACVRAQDIAKPVVVPPTGLWDGVDGPWSTFYLSSRSQGMARIYHVLPAPSQSFISLPSEAGCQTYAEWGNCTTSRGGLYRIPDASRSFHYGTYQYKKLVPLGMNVTGSYVWGQVGLQDSNSKYQVTGEYSSPDLWLGSMGINPIASSSNDPPSAVGGTAAPTFFESQMSPTEIAGRSWSYTAGAVNRPGSPLGSLILGGYDEARIDRSAGQPASFPMYPQPGKELQILISSMSFKADSKTTYHSVMNSLINVEPLVAQIWLEKVFCDVFEEHFGLIWEPQTNMYFVNDTQHDINISRKMSITFVILSNSTNITFPYTDFALTASYPLVPTSRRYFPLRRATYTSQVMLGRAFIQGAYLIADYDRKTFNISQVKTAKDLKPRIRAIPPPAKDAVNNTVIPVGLSVADKVADAKSHKLAAQTRVTAAASLTSVSVIIGIIGLFIWRRFRSRQKSEIVIPENGVIKKKEVPLHFDGKAELDGKTALPPEVHAEDLKEMDASQAPKELESKRFRYELPADVPAELYGDMPWQEKDAWVHELEVPDKKRVSKWRSFLRRKSEKEVIIKLNQEKCAMPDKSTVAIENHKKTHTTKQVDANTEKEDETNTKNQDKAVTEEAGFAKDEGSHATEHDRRTESEDHERSYDGG